MSAAARAAPPGSTGRYDGSRPISPAIGVGERLGRRVAAYSSHVRAP